jgi:hypothetical protein
MNRYRLTSGKRKITTKIIAKLAQTKTRKYFHLMVSKAVGAATKIRIEPRNSPATETAIPFARTGVGNISDGYT